MNDIPKQTRDAKQAAVLKPLRNPSQRSFSAVAIGYQVQFYRDDIYQFDVVAKSDDFARKLVKAWEDGKGQGDIAAMVHEANK